MKSANELIQRIAVRAPYFAMRDVRELVSGTVEASVSALHAGESELDPLTSSDAGRHMAILRALACASAQSDDRRRHYLASAAKIERAPQSHPEIRQRRGRAMGTLDGKRHACTTVELHAASKCAFRLSVEYRVLKEAAFEHMYASRRVQHATGTEGNLGA